jgi:Omp85 superfamily domain
MSAVRKRTAFSVRLSIVAAVATLAHGSLVSAQLPPNETPAPQFPVPAPIPMPTPAPTPATGPARWFDPASAPFIPIPSIGTDPNSGTSVGILPVWLRTNQDHDIDQIFAPDIIHNPYFGWATHARLYAYPSADEQWSAVAGIQERVQRGFDLEYQIGRARRQRWSFNLSVVYDRNGTPRFYGIGNDTPQSAETNYTANQEFARAQVGFNISKIWQLAYTVRVRQVDVLPGTLSGVESIQQRFGDTILGTEREFINRLSVVYDTRNDPTVPRNGMQWIAYYGVAGGGSGWVDSLYTETGVDGRAFWPVFHDTVVAAHVALRYMLSGNNPPFWALSSVGGAGSDVGGEQLLRGFGAGRFTDRDGFSTTVELRHRLLSFDAMATRVDVELTPFIDAGRVFPDSGTLPLEHLHTVGGIGFRGIARPFVVGYVDVGHGSEGFAVFTGISYPF